MTTTRIEKDSMGNIEVPAARLWGAQTQRSLEHFRISSEKMPPALIRALALTKRASARVNVDLGLLDADRAGAIIAAADEVLAGQHDAEFPLAIWQTGSGTQTNMNMNEVLANRASELLGASGAWPDGYTPMMTLTRARALTMCSPRPCTWRR
ncbi:Fumarate hydratase class II [Shimwellia blattae]|nr:Fumarate hydratase class II [Shimwellia blattae]